MCVHICVYIQIMHICSSKCPWARSSSAAVSLRVGQRQRVRPTKPPVEQTWLLWWLHHAGELPRRYRALWHWNSSVHTEAVGCVSSAARLSWQFSAELGTGPPSSQVWGRGAQQGRSPVRIASEDAPMTRKADLVCPSQGSSKQAIVQCC